MNNRPVRYSRVLPDRSLSLQQINESSKQWLTQKVSTISVHNTITVTFPTRALENPLPCYQFNTSFMLIETEWEHPNSQWNIPKATICINNLNTNNKRCTSNPTLKTKFLRNQTNRFKVMVTKNHRNWTNHNQERCRGHRGSLLVLQPKRKHSNRIRHLKRLPERKLLLPKSLRNNHTSPTFSMIG